MMRRRLLYAVVMLLVLAGSAFAAAQVDSRARNIYQLFARTNPKLEGGTIKKYVDIIMAAGKKYKQDPYVIAAIIVHESTVNAKAVSKGGDYGLMQVRWRVHEKAMKTVKELQAMDSKTKPKKRSFLDRLFNRNKS